MFERGIVKGCITSCGKHK